MTFELSLRLPAWLRNIHLFLLFTSYSCCFYYIPAPRVSSALLEGSFSFADFSRLFLRLLSEVVHSALDCLAGAIATYIHAYLILLMGESEFSILLHCRYLGPPPLCSFQDFFAYLGSFVDPLKF